MEKKKVPLPHEAISSAMLGKIKTVMHEYKKGDLKSSSGEKVTKPEQAQAIAINEAKTKEEGK